MYVIPAHRTHKKSAIRRLHVDLQEIYNEPLENIQVFPDEKNMFKWNILMTNIYNYGSRSIHLIAKFDSNYPLTPPTIGSTIALRHINVSSKVESQTNLYPICLDILNTSISKPYRGWSSAYSFRLILVHLHVCLFGKCLDIGLFKLNQKIAIKVSPPVVKPVLQPLPAFPIKAKPPASTFGLSVILRHSYLGTHLMSYCEPKVFHSIHFLRRDLFEICTHQSNIWLQLVKRKWNNIKTEQWRRTYILRQNAIYSEEIVCYHTKESYSDVILGWPIDMTYNRSKKDIDYIYTEQDLLSYDAFLNHGVNKTQWNYSFKEWLPVYICSEHFRRAKPIFEEKIMKLVVKDNPVSKYQSYDVSETNEWMKRRMGNSTSATTKPLRIRQYRQLPWFKKKEERLSNTAWFDKRMGRFTQNKFEPRMLLKIFPKLLMTNTLLLSTEGVKSSSKVLQCFCRVHQLLLAYPELVHCVNDTFKRFCSDGEKGRSKEACPNLGELISQFLMQTAVSWNTFFAVYLTESFDRGVFWRCKEYPEMADLQNCVVGQGADQTLLKHSWEVRKSSCRKLLFWHALYKICDKNNYEYYLGSPTRWQYKTFRVEVEKVLKLKSWMEFFNYVRPTLGHVTPSTESAITDCLKKSTHNSLRRGYHTEDIDWAGLPTYRSRLLRQGDTFMFPTNTKNIKIVETWNFNTRIYLDTSILVFNNSGSTHLYTIDYDNKSNVSNSIIHSGDIIDSKQGRHEVTIDLAAIEKNVTDMFIVFSSFKASMLCDMIQPDMSFSDQNSELCRCDLGQCSKDAKAVVMCHIQRKQGKWYLNTLNDELKDGSADNYAPIIKYCKTLINEL